ncbi:MAG: isoprenylcysteine carboxylmethyltransferase family protein [Deltaproteobacteria bacterium]|nr:isoprenylcysteine carboxylmethyltransferase family protein [Deltaproteobacteria bacterium]
MSSNAHIDPEARPPIPIKVWVAVVVRTAFLPAVFLLPAGTWRWWEVWVMTALWVVYAIVMTTYLAREDPALLEERRSASPTQEGQKTWDRLLMLVFYPAGLALLLVPGFDVMRFGWSEPLPLWVEIIGLAAHVPCFVLLGRVMRANTFLSRVVKIDEERGHEVITTGPYALVRHPMYVAIILLFIAIPLAVGSRYALIPAAVSIIILVLRTHLEDRTLHGELPGYPEYAAKTRYRLVPGIW